MRGVLDDFTCRTVTVGVHETTTVSIGCDVVVNK